MSEKTSQALLFGAFIVVGVVVVWGFSLVGSPSFNRKLFADRNRIEDLERLRVDVEQYFDEQRKLPDYLTDLGKVKPSWYGYQRSLEDPTTTKQYEYKKADAYSYELCADFELTSKDAQLERTRYGAHDKTWEHDIGRACFEFEIPAGKRESKSK